MEHVMKMEFALVRKILEVTSVHCVNWDIMNCQIAQKVNLDFQDTLKFNINISILEYPNVIVTTGKKGSAAMKRDCSNWIIINFRFC